MPGQLPHSQPVFSKKDDHVILTILILTYKRPQRCADFLISLSKIYQKFHKLVDILLIEDTGDTSLRVDSFPSYPYRHIYHKENLGFAESLIQGMTMALGKYVMYVADDDLISIEGFQSLLTYLGSHEPFFCSTLLYFSNKMGRRGRLLDEKIVVEDFFEASFHAPGLVFRTSFAHDFIRSSIFPVLKSHYFFSIFPQSVFALCCLYSGCEGRWLPFEVVLEANPMPSNLTDSRGRSYKDLISRISQLDSFYNILADLRGYYGSANYYPVLYY